MAVNELNLTVSPRKFTLENRLLGLLEIIFAPMLLVQALYMDAGRNSTNPMFKQLLAFLGVLYIGGWICGAVGMFRQKIYGNTKASKIVFVIQMTLLTLALLFSAQESLGISYENGGDAFFAVCDAGYPLSHLFMIVVGIFVWRAKVWKGFSRFAPFFVGAALPLTFALMPLFGMNVGFFSFCGLTTIGLGVIGYRIYSEKNKSVAA